VPLLAAGAVATYRSAWSISLEGATGPAYASVMALALGDDLSFVGPSQSVVGLLTGQTLAVAVAAPFGNADVAGQHERVWLSDGNTRSIFQLSVRVPVRSGFSVLYSAGSLGFAERSPLYWDPQEHVSHALGFELGVRSDAGLALTARVLPGIGRSIEGLTPGDPTRFGGTDPGAARFVGQLAGTVDLGIRRRHWETAVGAAFGTGRSGGYQRFDGNLRVRYIP
jgi:hypothetical protein